MHIRLRLAAVAAPALLVIASSSAGAQSRLHGTMRFGIDFGGDRVMQFEYDDGTTPDVRAGMGMVLAVGGVLEAIEHRGHALDAQLGAGVKYSTIPEATNQDATWLRFPVEGLLFYRAPAGLRVGGGTTVHMRNVFSTSGDAANGRVEFMAKPGLLLQAEYLRRNVAFDVRYTSLEYEVSGASGTVDASGLGVGVTFFFGRGAAER